MGRDGTQSGYAVKRKQSVRAADRTDERTLETRLAIVHAARDVMLQSGYGAARVEDILKVAGISRPTFYRHFKDKFDVAKAYHAMSRDEVSGPWTRIADIDFRDRQALCGWLETLLDTFIARRDELIVWAEMSSVEPDYLLRMPRQMPELIAKLALSIPAFAKAQSQAPTSGVNGKAIDPGPVWVDAYMLLEQIIYSFTSMAIGRQHPISKDMSIRHFADRLLAFITAYP